MRHPRFELPATRFDEPKHPGKDAGEKPLLFLDGRVVDSKKRRVGEGHRMPAVLPLDDAPRFDDNLAPRRQSADLLGNKTFFRNSRLGQLFGQQGQLLTTMATTLDFLVTLANRHGITPVNEKTSIGPAVLKAKSLRRKLFL